MANLLSDSSAKEIPTCKYNFQRDILQINIIKQSLEKHLPDSKWKVSIPNPLYSTLLNKWLHFQTQQHFELSPALMNRRISFNFIKSEARTSSFLWWEDAELTNWLIWEHTYAHARSKFNRVLILADVSWEQASCGNARFLLVSFLVVCLEYE